LTNYLNKNNGSFTYLDIFGKSLAHLLCFIAVQGQAKKNWPIINKNKLYFMQVSLVISGPAILDRKYEICRKKDTI
jgi:hypothetical protein